MHSARFGCCHARFGAFRDEGAFIFSEDRKLPEDHAPDGGACVDALGDDVEVDATLTEIIKQRQQMQGGSSEAIQLPHHQCVARAQGSQQIIQPLAADDLPRDAVIAINDIAARRGI